MSGRTEGAAPLPAYEVLNRAKRINVVGTAGSGKSTFARRLAELKGLPCVEMDALFWKPQWTEATDAEFFPKLESALAGESWVLDGNYSRSRPIKWSRVEVVVFIDLPFLQTIGRVTARTLRRCLSGNEVWRGTGNRETFGQSFFSSDSVVWWAIQNHRSNRERYLDPEYYADYQPLDLVHLDSARAVAECLAGVAREQ
ncbi:MAG: adenylate kinase [Pseudomonadota bacterium]